MSDAPRVPSLARCCAFLTLVAAVSSCAVTSTIDSKIYRVDGATGSNYYRVTISSSSFFAETNYQTGLFPSPAVDAFLADHGDLSTTISNAEEDIRKALATEQLAAYKAYLAALREGEKNEIAAAAHRLRALQRIPAAAMGPNDEFVDLKTTNPLFTGLVDHTMGKKFVVAFSADPDAILNHIAAFAEEAETINAVEGAINAVVLSTSGVDLDRAAAEAPAIGSVGAQLQEIARSGNIENLTELSEVVDRARATVETLP